MFYCTNCLIPSTKPHIKFNQDGICSACTAFVNRPNINWKERKEIFLELINDIKKENTSNWDCVIPVSGGKDSMYQALKMREFGLKPLCVTSTTCDLSPLGRKNIEVLKSLGFDYIEFTTDRKIRTKLNRIGLEMIGDISWPEHISINTIPKWVGSMPKAVTIGRKMGVKISTAGVASMKIPTANKITLIIINIIILLSLTDNKALLIS